MRKANINDLFAIARLIDELGLKEQLFNAQKGTDDLEKIGFDFIFDLLSKATTKEMQNKIYEVLASPFEMSAEEVGLMEIDELVKGLKECWNINTVINFIKRVGTLTS